MEIISLETQIAQQYLLSEYMGIALTDDVVNLSQMTEKDLLINGICIVYIKKGKASFSISGEDCVAEAGELLVINHGLQINDMMISADMQFLSFLLSKDFVKSLTSRLQIDWIIRSEMEYFKHIKIELTEQEQNNQCLYYQLLDSKRLQSLHQQQGIDALCEAFGYEMLDVMDKRGLLDEKKTQHIGQEFGVAQHHFDQFMYLLVNSKKFERKVSWYADQLCITPKYLNIICQKVVQQNPSVLIEKELTQRAIQLLREKELSIKQIAEQLGFSNQSHFGSYMRRTTGNSPLDIRRVNK